MNIYKLNDAKRMILRHWKDIKDLSVARISGRPWKNSHM